MAAKLNIQLTKEQQQFLALGVIVLGGGGWAYWQYFWKPVSLRIADARTKIEQVEGEIRTAESQAARRDKIVKELEILNQQAAAAEKRLPKTKDVPAVIDTLAALARKHRVVLSSFAPGGASQKQFFIEIPYTVACKGSYHDIGRFLAAIALEERIFNVRNVSYGGGGAAAMAGSPMLSVNLTLIAYQYKG